MFGLPFQRSLVLGSGLHRIRDAAVSAITLAAGAALLVGADFGMAIWLQVPLMLWLLTLGLPTTLTVLVLATFWGRFEPLYGITLFKVMACLLAPVVHVAVMERLRRWGSGGARPGDIRLET